MSSEKICEVAVKPDNLQKRITLTGRVINNAKNIFFLVAGESKKDVLSEIIEKKIEYLKYPAAHIHNEGFLTWYLDKAAAEETS